MRRKSVVPSVVPVDRQITNANSRFFENDDTPSQQRLFQSGQVPRQQFYLPIRTTSGRASEQDDGWLAIDIVRQQCAKVGIRRHKNSILFLGGSQNRFIIRRLKSEIPDMRGVVADSPQFLGESRGERVVDQEPHGTVSGNSRSRSA